jgi:hypothetical protein
MFYCRLVAVAVALGSLASAGMAAATSESKRPALTVAFSEDEKTIDVKYGDNKWHLPRPVVSPWKFEPVGKVYWVSPGGRDNGSGTKGKPFQTLQKALSLVKPGDIVYALPGTYREYLELRTSGEEGRPIVLSCAPGALGKVKLEPPTKPDAKGRVLAGISVVLAKHVWINGLVIEGARGLPRAAKANETMIGTNGISWEDGAGPGCRATNNVVYRHVHCGLKEIQQGAVGAGILLQGNVVFDNGLDAHDHGIYMPSDRVRMDGNLVFNNAGYGIHAYSKPRGQIITRNVCFGHPWAGILIAGSETKVYSNTCAYNYIGIFYYGGTSKNNSVRDNIFAFNKTDCMYGDGGAQLGAPANNLDDANCYFPGKPSPRLEPGKNEVLSDPRFRDGKHRDFRLRPASPCVGAGVDVGLPFEGKRPNLGAY